MQGFLRQNSQTLRSSSPTKLVPHPFYILSVVDHCLDLSPLFKTLAKNAIFPKHSISRHGGEKKGTSIFPIF